MGVDGIRRTVEGRLVSVIVKRLFSYIGGVVGGAPTGVFERPKRGIFRSMDFFGLEDTPQTGHLENFKTVRL